MGALPASPEFSRVIEADRLADEPVEMTIEASPEERAALARRFDLAGLDRLVADVLVERGEGKAAVKVTFDWRAEATQTCVVSLEPVPVALHERTVVLFAPDDEVRPGQPGRELDLACMDDEDIVEPMIDGEIDLGETLAELFALSLDPYPRKPDAVAPGGWRIMTEAEALEAAEAEKVAQSPFAALAELKEKK